MAEAALRSQPVKVADDTTGIAAEFVVVFLKFIQLFNDRHRQDHGIVGKTANGLTVVQEHIGIKDKIFIGHESRRRRGLI